MSTFAIPNENGVAVKAASSLKLLTLKFLLKNFSKKVSKNLQIKK